MRCSRPARAPTACTARAASRRARRAWPPGWRPTSSTSTPPPPWRTAGSAAPGACSSRSSPDPTTAGSRSTRATSRTPRATRRRRGQLAGRAADLGRRFDVADLEMLGLALEGASLVACAEVDDGMRCLDEATAAALEGEATIPISGAWACCFLVSACTSVLDYERAVEWCDRIASFAERFGSRYMLAFCRAEYGAVDVWRGRWSEAETLLAASLDDFAHSRPAWVGSPLLGLAELRRQQGRADEAAELLDRLGPYAPAQICRARLALDHGDALRAVELARARAAPGAAGAEARPRGRAPSTRRGAHRPRRARRGRRRARRPARGRTAGRHDGASRVRRPGRGHAGGRARRCTTARGRCSRTRSTASRAAARRSRPHARGSSSPRASWRSTAPTPPSGRRATALDALVAARREDRGRARAAGAPGGRRGAWRPDRGHGPRAAGAAARRRRADEPPDRRAAGGQRAHRAPARDEHPAQARRSVADGSRRVRRALGPARCSG